MPAGTDADTVALYFLLASLILAIALSLLSRGMGRAVRPFIEGYYAAGAYELSTPSWAQIISLQLVRSLLFLLASLPVLAVWRGSLRGLALALGFAIFTLVAFMPVISAYWFPWQLRVYHGLELAADSFLYAGALVALLVRRPAVVA